MVTQIRIFQHIFLWSTIRNRNTLQPQPNASKSIHWYRSNLWYEATDYYVYSQETLDDLCWKLSGNVKLQRPKRPRRS